LLRGLPSTSIAGSGSVLLAAGAKGGIDCPTIDGPSPSRERELSSQAFLDPEGMSAGDFNCIPAGRSVLSHTGACTSFPADAGCYYADDDDEPELEMQQYAIFDANNLRRRQLET
jgi:hypothetical protein